MILLVVVFLTVRDVFDRLEKIERYPAKSLSHSVPIMRDLFFFSTLPVVIFAPLAGVLGTRIPPAQVFYLIGIWGGGVVNKAVKKDSLTVNIL